MNSPNIDPGENRKYFLIGIGGAGMSAIAQVLKGMGHDVSGSDMKESRYTSTLKNEGIRVLIGHDSKNIEDADAAVYSTAIPRSNIELKTAEERGIPIYSRSDILAWILNSKKGIAIAGTHGKTTTTSMISMMLQGLGLDPTIIVGGELNELGSNARFGKGDLVVAEACESDGSFLKYRPFIGVVTNIEEDHFDFYEDMEEIIRSFNRFMANTRPGGFIVLNGDEIKISDFLHLEKKKAIFFGIGENNDIYAEKIKLGNFSSSYTLVISRDRAKEKYKIKLNVPGIHNIKNSLAAFSVCRAMDLDIEKAAGELKNFTGVKRRFEKRGEIKGAVIFDDYAHHPSEVSATLEAAAEEKARRIITVFQPHRYSRLAGLEKKFAVCFKYSDILIITDVYGAGEQPIPGITGKFLIDSIIESGFENKIIYIPKLKDISEYLEQNIKENDMILVMGAGDITRVSDELLRS